MGLLGTLARISYDVAFSILVIYIPITWHRPSKRQITNCIELAGFLNWDVVWCGRGSFPCRTEEEAKHGKRPHLSFIHPR